MGNEVGHLVAHGIGRALAGAWLLAAVLPAIAAPFAYITNQGSNDVSVIDLASQRVVATVPVGLAPAGVVASSHAGKVFVSNPGSKTISVIETLERYDAAQMRYSYRMKDGGALPVSNYTSTLTVTGEGNTSAVEWRGAFYRAYPNNDPPPEKNDEAAVKAVTGVYRSGLANLKKIVEAR